MRRSGLELTTLLAVVTVTAAIAVAWSEHLPVRDPDGSTGPTYVRLPIIVVLALLIDVTPRIVLRAVRHRDLRSAAGAVVRDRWTRANLQFMLVGLTAWYATYAAVRNLKAFVPWVNHGLYDTDLARLDRVIFFGHRPSAVLHAAMGTDIAAHVLSFVYLAWIAALPASLALALVWVKRDRLSSWWVTAVSVDWVIGVAINYALPTVGPVYERPGDFASLATTHTTLLQQSMWDERVQMLADPAHSHVQNIAAFASLHVAIATTALVVARRGGLHRAAVWALRVFLVATVLATVYFGWHYVSDVVAGFLLGIVGAAVGERFAAPEPPDRDAVSDVESPEDAGSSRVLGRSGSRPEV